MTKYWNQNDISVLLLANGCHCDITEHQTNMRPLICQTQKQWALLLEPRRSATHKGNCQVCNKLSRLNTFCFHHISRFVKLDLVTLIKIPRGWRLNHVSETGRRKKSEEEIKINGASETNYHRKQIKMVLHFYTQKTFRLSFVNVFVKSSLVFISLFVKFHCRHFSSQELFVQRDLSGVAV